MLKKILILSVFLGLISCFQKKNEFKKPRFTTIGLSPYKEKCILEDSIEVFNGFYKLIINEKLKRGYTLKISTSKKGLEFIPIKE